MEPKGITASLGMEQKSAAPNKTTVENFKFAILSRIITVEYKTRTTGVTTHTVVVKALSDFVSHYDGRYHVRDESTLKVKTPHKGLTYGEIAFGLKKFFVEFEHPLKKDQTERLVMEVSWKHKQQADHPEVAMTTLCPTDVLKFIVQLPHNDHVVKTEGIVRVHHGAHDHISIVDIPLTGPAYIWEVLQPVDGLYYQIKWKWSH